METKSEYNEGYTTGVALTVNEALLIINEEFAKNPELIKLQLAISKRINKIGLDNYKKPDPKKLKAAFKSIYETKSI